MNNEQKQESREAPEGGPRPFTEAQLKAFADEAIHGQTITPDRLYVDLRLLKDFGIGTVMALAARDGEEKAREVYRIVNKNLVQYGIRYFDDPSYYFADAGYSFEDIDAAMKDPAMADLIYRMSPVTNVPSILVAHMVVNANHSAMLRKTGSVRVILNTWPLVLSNNTLPLLGTYITELLDVDVEIICSDPQKIPRNKWLSFDEYYFYYLSEFTHNADVQKAFEDLLFLSKRGYAIPLYARKMNVIIDREFLIRELIKIETTFNALFDQFKVIPIQDCSPYIPVVKSEDEKATKES